jgi:hypothetical protein
MRPSLLNVRYTPLTRCERAAITTKIKRHVYKAYPIFLPLDAEPFLYGDEIFIPTVLAEQPSGLLKTRIAIKRFLPEDKLCLS